MAVNYLEQLEKAIIFIENSLEENIKAEDAACAAGYSYYHFHRIFEAVLGETVGSYIRSRRLRRAADDLIYTEKRILDIAIGYQFESQEAFNRAFKKAYKVSPGVYRKNRIDTLIGNKKELTRVSLKHLQNGVTIQPEIRVNDPVKLIGIRGKTTLKNNRLMDLWKIFNSRVGEIENRVSCIRGYGVCETDPDFDLINFDENTESSHFIGAEVTSFDHVPDGMDNKILSGGKYAVFIHRGKLDSLKLTYDYIWGTWALCSGFELDLRDDFEFYDERFLGPENDQSEFEIHIPIK